MQGGTLGWLVMSSGLLMGTGGCGEGSGDTTDRKPVGPAVAGEGGERAGTVITDGGFGPGEAGTAGSEGGAGSSGGASTPSGGASTPSEGGAPQSEGGATSNEAGAAGAAFECDPVPDVATAVFEELGQLGTTGAQPFAVSADGSTVVGTSRVDTLSHAFRWRHGSGMEDLWTDATRLAGALMSNCDGSVIVGEVGDGQHDGVVGAARWVDGVGQTPLQCQKGTALVAAISAAGNAVVGTCETGPSLVDNHAARWLGNATIGLPFVDIAAYGFDVSADGGVFVGQSLDPAWDGAFTWKEGEDYTKVGPVGGYPAKVSADGSCVVGTTLSAEVAFRWRASGTTNVQCGAGYVSCVPVAVSEDGGVIVLATNKDTLIWTDAKGIVPFKTAVVAAGAQLGAWTSISVSGMTPDARVFVGTVTAAGGKKSGYRLQVPAGTF